MEQRKYDLDFKEAIDIVLDGGAVKGQHFVDGAFLKLNKSGHLVVVDATQSYEEKTSFFKGLSEQKFRKLTTLTMRELCD